MACNRPQRTKQCGCFFFMYFSSYDVREFHTSSGRCCGVTVYIQLAFGESKSLGDASINDLSVLPVAVCINIPWTMRSALILVARICCISVRAFVKRHWRCGHRRRVTLTFKKAAVWSLLQGRACFSNAFQGILHISLGMYFITDTHVLSEM